MYDVQSQSFVKFAAVGCVARDKAHVHPVLFWESDHIPIRVWMMPNGEVWVHVQASTAEQAQELWNLITSTLDVQAWTEEVLDNV